MTCPRCRAENRDGARFCRECGTAFTAVCSACGAKLEAASKFCDSCGASLAATPAQPTAAPRFASPESYTPKHLAEKILSSKSALEGERKQVTVLFADLKGSMELLADRDPEEARKILDPVLERMMEAVHHYEGTVNQVMGDGIMALFGAPVAHEDHAVRASYAALRMQRRINLYVDEIQRGGGTPVHDEPREIRERVAGKLLMLDRALEPLLTPLLALLDVPVEDAAWAALDPPQRRQRTLDAIKRLLLRESQVQPLLLLFDKTSGSAAAKEQLDLPFIGPRSESTQVSSGVIDSDTASFLPYGPLVSEWLAFLAERLTAEFLRDVAGGPRS